MSIRSVLTRTTASLGTLVFLVVYATVASAAAKTPGSYRALTHQEASATALSLPRPISRHAPSPVTATDNCARVRAHLAQYTDHGKHDAICVTAGTTGGINKSSGTPPLCQVNSVNLLRFSACFYDSWGFGIVNAQGKVIGSASGKTLFWNSLSYKSRIWTEYIEVHWLSIEGVAIGSTFTSPLTCNDTTSGDCQKTGTGEWEGQTKYILVTKPEVFSGELGFGSAATSVTTMSFSVNMVVDTPGSKPTPFPLGPSATMRCDSESYFKPTYGGCTYPGWTLNVLYVHIADPKVTEAAKFMLSAQNTIPNHVGEIGYKALTRNTSKSVQRRNHRVACKGVTSPPGNSCDEYPFAATNQGASLVPPGYYAHKSINTKQNSQVGSNLSSFLLKNRIIAFNPATAADPFYVDIIS